MYNIDILRFFWSISVVLLNFSPLIDISFERYVKILFNEGIFIPTFSNNATEIKMNAR